MTPGHVPSPSRLRPGRESRVANADANGDLGVRLLAALYALQLAIERLVPLRLFTVNVEILHSLELAAWKTRSAPVPGARWAGEADRAALLAFGISPEELAARFRLGARVAVLERGGRVVAWNWFASDGRDYYDWLRYGLEPGELWAFDGRTNPACRGQGHFAALRGFAAAALAREGYLRIVNTADWLNRASLHARLKTGAREIGRLGYIRIMGLTLVWHRGRLRLGQWGPGQRLLLRPLAGETEG